MAFFGYIFKSNHNNRKTPSGIEVAYYFDTLVCSMFNKKVSGCSARGAELHSISLFTQYLVSEATDWARIKSAPASAASYHTANFPNDGVAVALESIKV